MHNSTWFLISSSPQTQINMYVHVCVCLYIYIYIVPIKREGEFLLDVVSECKQLR